MGKPTVIRLIYRTHRGNTFPLTAERDEWLGTLQGGAQVQLCEPPDDPMQLYNTLSQHVEQLNQQRRLLVGYELGVRDSGLLTMMTVLRQFGAFLAFPVYVPAYRTRGQTISLADSLKLQEWSEVEFAGYYAMGRVQPLVEGFLEAK